MERSCIMGCTEFSHTYKPKNAYIREAWKNMLGLEHFERSGKVCDKHFAKNMFASFKRIRLNRDALPTLNTRRETFDANAKCVFFCKDAIHFFNLPITKSLCNQWLDRLCLPRYDPSFQVCNRHFSEDMLSASGETLTENAVPNRNLPSGGRKYYWVPNRIQNTSKVGKNETLPMPDSTTDIIPEKTNVASELLADQLNDLPAMLMDYQLRIQGKYMCDVFELPEYILVHSIVYFKQHKLPSSIDLTESNVAPKTCAISVRKDLVASPEISPLLSRIPPAITVTAVVATEPVTSNKRKTFVLTEPNVDYRFYEPSNKMPKRQREVHSSLTTRDAGTQCDHQLDMYVEKMTQSKIMGFSVSSTSESNLQECLECGEVLPNLSTLQRHAALHKKQPSLCPNCGGVFSSQLELKIHEKDEHSGMKKPLRCPRIKCNKAFHSRKRLNKHIGQHVHDTDHKCNKCTQLFTSSFKLSCHKKRNPNCSKRKWFKKKFERLTLCYRRSRYKKSV